MNNVIDFVTSSTKLSRTQKESFVDSVDYLQSPEVSYEVLQYIEELAELVDNWDGRGAVAPTETAVRGAFRWVGELFRGDTPKPDIFPVPNGNIQLEWSCFGLDIEIEIASISTCYVSFEDHQEGGEEWERKFTYDIGQLSHVMTLLGERSVPNDRLANFV